MDNKIELIGLSKEELQEHLKQLGEPAFRAKQIWLIACCIDASLQGGMVGTDFGNGFWNYLCRDASMYPAKK